MLVIIHTFKLLRGVKKIEYKMNIYIQSKENTKKRKNEKTKNENVTYYETLSLCLAYKLQTQHRRVSRFRT